MRKSNSGPRAAKGSSQLSPKAVSSPWDWNEAVREMGLKQGVAATTLIKASLVVLGVPL
jgi:hypothetical protein